MEGKDITKYMIESEKKLERDLVNRIKKIGGMCIKLTSQHMSGLPDRLCLFPNGTAVFVEMKTTGQKPRKIQQLVHSRIRSLSFKVVIIDSSEKIKKLILDHRN